MKYSEYLQTNQSFQTSVNLEFDLNDISKIKGYIPTEKSVAILREFLNSFYYSSDNQNRANVLIGPYGRGKSHLLLVLTALTSLDIYRTDKNNSKELTKVLKDLCEKISKVDKETGALAKAIVESNIRTLPVVVNSNSRDINQSFLMALNTALLSAGLDDLLPKTYFDSAYDVVKKWENEVPDAYDKFVVELKRLKKTAEQICIGLKRFDNNCYDLFCEIYPKVAAGMKFNPLINMDVVKLYLSVNDALCNQTKYSGLNIIFDEFSKFLESNLDKSQMYNFKIIQDLAEAASRSGKKQIHFTCITHKDITEYSSSDSFRTVEGRFAKIHFIASSEQNYELISNAIIKQKGFNTFLKKHQNEIDNVINMTLRANVFNDLSEEDFESKVVYGCFPMAPLTAYSLLRISELIGQNERTMFTYLASQGKNTVGEFIKKEHKTLELVTVDSIYDYFEDLLRKEVFNASVHSLWAKADSAICQLEDVNQKRIVKAVSIISMIKDGILKTIPAHIKAALLMDDKTFENASEFLQKEHILSQRDSAEFVMLTANGVDVQRNITNLIESKALKINVCEELNNRCDLGYVVPHEHNDSKGIIRYFKKVFISGDLFCKYKNAMQILNDYPYDGVIFYVVENEKNLSKEVKSKVHSFKDYPNIVICLSGMRFACEELLKKIVAASQLKEIAHQQNDIHYVEEVEYFEEDLQRQLSNTVEMMYSPSSENSEYWNCDGNLNIFRQAQLNSKISSICDRVFSLTPIVNNEMVNKKSLNTQNKKARDLVVEWLLYHTDDLKIPCMDGFGPEVSIFKSAIQFTGLDCNEEPQDDGIKNVLNYIKDFIKGCENKKGEFKTLYEQLISKPYGMRRGLIPIFLAYILRQYKENIVLYYHDKEVELDEKVLSNLNDNPEAYYLLLETGTLDKDKYLDDLNDLFSGYFDQQSGAANRVYLIIRNMQNWYRSLPGYSKKYSIYLSNGEEKRVEENVIILRNDLSKYDVNARDLIFEKWVGDFSANGDYTECFIKIKDCKNILDNQIRLFKNELSSTLIALFSPGYKGGLPNAMQSWYKKLPENVKKHVFDSNTNALLSLASQIDSYDEISLLEELSVSLEALTIEDWNDETYRSFMRDISECLRKLSEYKESGATESGECSLSISMPGIKIEKNFQTEGISPLGKTAYNNLLATFDEYNDSLDPDEKLAIIAKLIGQITL